MYEEIISAWRTPKWHPDMGDPEIELSLLKTFCTKVASSFPSLKPELENFEEGYMCVNFKRDDIKILELHVTEPKSKQFCIFSFIEEKDDELMFHDSADGISFMSEVLKRN